VVIDLGFVEYLLLLLDLCPPSLHLGLLHHLLHHFDVTTHVLVYVLHVEDMQSQVLHLRVQGGHWGEGRGRLREGRAEHGPSALLGPSTTSGRGDSTLPLIVGGMETASPPECGELLLNYKDPGSAGREFTI
jgi:hypothetical protein